MYYRQHNSWGDSLGSHQLGTCDGLWRHISLGNRGCPMRGFKENEMQPCGRMGPYRGIGQWREADSARSGGYRIWQTAFPQQVLTKRESPSCYDRKAFGG